MIPCRHCATPFATKNDEDHFCCAGCHYAFSLINENDLTRFYELRGNQVLAPVGDVAFAKAETAWIESRLEKNADAPIDCHLEGASCLGCVWLLEKLFQESIPGGRIEIRLNEASARLHPVGNAEGLLHFIRLAPSFGYSFSSPHAADLGTSESSKLLARLGVTAGLAMNCMGFSLPRYLGMPRDFEYAKLFDQIAWLSATAALFVGGSWFIQRAFRALKHGQIHIDLPISLGLVAAYIGSLIGWFNGEADLIYFDFVATFSTLMLLGRFLQTKALERNRRKLNEQTPRAEAVLHASLDEKIAAETLTAHQSFRLQGAQVLPVKARLLSPIAECSLEWIDGEPEPRLFHQAEPIPAGARLLGRSTIQLEALEAWEDSLLAGLLAARQPDQRSELADRFLRLYLIVIFIIALAAGAFWLEQAPWTSALQVVISILVISCPCALGVSLPMANDLATGAARHHGVHVTSPSFWSRLLHVKHCVLDKTGTLTHDQPEILSSEHLDELNSEELDALASLTQCSAHPFSRALYRYATHQLGRTPEIEFSHLEELPGIGLQARHPSGQLWLLTKIQGQGTSCQLLIDQQSRFRVSFQEGLRDDAPAAIHQCQRLGIASQILSGDQPASVTRVAELLQLPAASALGNQSPIDKAQWITNHTKHSLFLGDGLNDSLAIEAASVAGCPATGQGWTKAKVDFYYTNPSLTFLPHLFLIAKKYHTARRRAVLFALLYNGIAIALCLNGHMTPLLASILMPLSSLFSLSLVVFPFKKKSQLFALDGMLENSLGFASNGNNKCQLKPQKSLV